MSQALRILIVEDELIIAEAIKEMAEDLGHEVVDIASNYNEAIESLLSTKFDLALLDINLKDAIKTGFDIANILHETYKTPFIFITAYADAKFLAKAKDLNPQGYILKPINTDRLYIAIELAMDNAKAAKGASKTNTGELQGLFQDSFYIKDGTYIHHIYFDDIFYLKSEGNYTEIITKSRTYVIRSLLKEIIEKLPSQYFIRTHRSYIIHIAKVTKISPFDLEINNELKIPLGETFKKDVLNFFKDLIK